MKLKSKVTAGLKTQKVTKVAKAAASVKQKVAKVAKLAAHFYRQLRGTSLKLANLRAADYTGQAFVDVPKGLVPAVVIATGTYGTSVSAVPAKGSVVQVDKTRAFDTGQLKNARVLHPKEAGAYFKKHGTAHKLRQGKKEVTGILLGSLDEMYVGFLNTATGAFETLETKSISDGRNKKATFAMVS